MSARSLNRVMLIGNLTRDPELRYTPQGTAVCTFGLATNRSWMPADGSQRQEETEYHRVVAWAKLAEICSQLLYKGRKVYVEGRLQTRRFTGQDGNEREITEVVIDSMIALGQPKSKDEGDEDFGYVPQVEATPPKPQTPPTASVVQTSQAHDEEDLVANAVAAEDQPVVTPTQPKKPTKKSSEPATPPAEAEKPVDTDDIPF